MHKSALDFPPVMESYRLAAEWQNVVVIKSDTIFAPVDAKNRKRWHVPDIDGESGPEWMQDCLGTLAVVKGDITRRASFGTYHSIAHEKIVADAAQRIGMPVPPVFILEKTAADNHSRHFSASPRVTPDARHSPPFEILMADDLFGAAPLLDGWTQNADRSPLNVLSGGKPNAQKSRVFLPDNEQAALMAPEMMPMVLKYWFFWSSDIRNHVREQIANSPKVQRVMDGIENFPDDEIKLIVNRLPNALCSPKQKQKTIDGLRYGRDMLRAQINQAFDLV